jgi:hypothetical protein
MASDIKWCDHMTVGHYLLPIPTCSSASIVKFSEGLPSQQWSPKASCGLCPQWPRRINTTSNQELGPRPLFLQRSLLHVYSWDTVMRKKVTVTATPNTHRGSHGGSWAPVTWQVPRSALQLGLREPCEAHSVVSPFHGQDNGGSNGFKHFPDISQQIKGRIGKEMKYTHVL